MTQMDETAYLGWLCERAKDLPRDLIMYKTADGFGYADVGHTLAPGRTPYARAFAKPKKNPDGQPISYELISKATQ